MDLSLNIAICEDIVRKKPVGVRRGRAGLVEIYDALYTQAPPSEAQIPVLEAVAYFCDLNGGIPGTLTEIANRAGVVYATSHGHIQKLLGKKMVERLGKHGGWRNIRPTALGRAFLER